AFIPEQNLNPRTQLSPIFRKLVGDTQAQHTNVPKADYLRFLVGYDRFFFLRAINPTNSFLLSAAFNGSLNLSEGPGGDFRNPQPKPDDPKFKKLQVSPGIIGGVSGCSKLNASRANVFCIKIHPNVFEDQYKFEGFLQTVLQTDYMHGRLTPR